MLTAEVLELLKALTHTVSEQTSTIKNLQDEVQELRAQLTLPTPEKRRPWWKVWGIK